MRDFNSPTVHTPATPSGRAGAQLCGRPNQRFRRDTKPLMQSPGHGHRKWPLVTEHLVNSVRCPMNGTRSFGASPRCAITNLMAATACRCASAPESARCTASARHCSKREGRIRAGPWTSSPTPWRAADAFARQGVRLRFIRPGKPVENAYIASFNGKFRDE